MKTADSRKLRTQTRSSATRRLEGVKVTYPS